MKKAINDELTQLRGRQQWLEREVYDSRPRPDEMDRLGSRESPSRSNSPRAAELKIVNEQILALELAQKHSAQQSAKAIKGHAENRSMKSEVFEWLDKNMQKFPSMDNAAQAIAGELQPITFRTARDWVGEWKKLRSTGTP